MKLVFGLIVMIIGLVLLQQINEEAPMASETTGDVAETEKVTLSSDEYPVVEVIDGDTVLLNINGEVESIRLVGLNTPEVTGPYRDAECFGEEASTEAKRLLAGKTVSFIGDPTQDVRDRYDRLLGYVFLPGGDNFAELMIESGHGYEFTFNNPYQYQSEFKGAEQTAKANQVGLWAEGVCD